MDVDELRMWLAVRVDLGMPKGKLAAQAGHGFVGAFAKAHVKDPIRAADYMNDGQSKVTVQVANEAALRRVATECEAAGIPHAFVVDAGRTVFAGPTPTVCGFGPCLRSELPPYLKRLRLWEEREGDAQNAERAALSNSVS